MENQAQKTVLITGASSGIGRELARLFAKDGYKLVVVGRNSEALEQLASAQYNQYGTDTTIIQKDLADANAPQEIYDEVQGRGIKIDVLVNDAGFGEYGQFATETDLQKELAVVQVNAVALMHLTKLFIKDMVSHGAGKILMLGSEVSVIPNPMMAVYGATKAFIKSFSEAILNELQGTGVTVTVLMPGATNTNFFNTAGAAHVKGADPNKTANPADVAKEGYEALMAGKDHVVAGWANKATVVMGHVMPDTFLTKQVRRDMTPKEEAEAEQKEQLTSFLVGLGAVVGVAAGIWLTYRKSSATDKLEYDYEVGKAKWKARNKVKSAVNTARDAYNKTKSTVEDAMS